MNDTKYSIIIDNGTGFTKMGFSGNLDPEFVFPTAIADLAKKNTMSISTKNDEYNYYIGDEAIKIASTSQNHAVTYPMQNGLIDNWDMMEKFWHQSIYHYLKCDPQEHFFVLTEPPMNPPENRENVAEIFFETFNVPGLYIGVQAVFALIGCNTTVLEDPNEKEGSKLQEIDEEQRKAIKELTGVVVDSGDGVTHVVPICDGFVLGSNIKHIPIAGRKITQFMSSMIKDRGETIPNEDLYLATMDIKEKYGYVTSDLLKEYSRYDNKKFDEKTKTYYSKLPTFKGIGRLSNKPFKIHLGYELFLGPESFFSPEIIDKDWKSSLDEVIDNTIQQCPIDYRRKLYSNIVFSGGSTQFKNFDRRLQITVQDRVNERLKKFINEEVKPKPINVKVTNSLAQKHVVWLGGSHLANQSTFQKSVHTREQYQENGPSCCRFNPVFGF